MTSSNRAGPNIAKPDTSEMIVIHKALRREFALLPAVVAAVEEADRRQVRRIAAHARLAIALLHAHHDSEDRLIWPLLLQRLPVDKSLITTMEKQHAVVADIEETIGRELDGWVETEGTADRNAITENLSALNTALKEHLDLEETAVLPLVRNHLSIPEWNASFDYAQHHTPVAAGAGLLLVGMVLEDALPDERAQFFGHMPAVARWAWQLLGPRLYRRYTDNVRRHIDPRATRLR